MATIALYINDATLWNVAQSATTNLIITPANSNTYAGAATIPIQVTAAVVSTPVITLTSSTISHKTAAFQVTCTEQGRFVYHISREFSYNLTACSLTIAQI